jgi:hypothetical protein
MKLTNKISLISGLGVLALVGTGFAAWSFSEGNTAATDGQANVLTVASTTGKVTILTQTASFTLDELYDSSSSAILSSGKIQGVITWSGEISAKYTGATGDGATVSRTWTASIGTGLSTYIQFVGTGTGTWVDSTAITLPALQFITDKAPQKLTDYNTMSTAIAGAKITFSFSAAIVD